MIKKLREIKTILKSKKWKIWILKTSTVCLLFFSLSTFLMGVYLPEFYERFFIDLQMSLPSSLFTSFCFLCISYIHNFCLYHRVSAWALFIESLLNLISLNIFPVDHYQLYTYIYGHFILIPTTIICTFLLIKKI